jgi:branched-chain amino acid transport system substrate-binding protein
VDRRKRWGLLLLVVPLLAASACGARLTSEQIKTANARRTTPAAQAASAVTGDTVTSTTLAAAANTGAGGGSTPGGASTGTGSSGNNPAAAGAKCTPSGGALDVGIDDGNVTTGSVATVSGPVPGLFKNMQQGVKAYFNYINSQGGVCGRKLNVQLADDRLDAGTNRAATDAMKSKVFAFVGGYSVVDDGGASVLEGTGIPDIGSAIGTRRASMVENFATTPNEPSATTNGAAGQFKYFMAHYGVTKAAIVWPAQSDARNRGIAYGNDMKAAGLNLVETFEVAVTETNYAGVATKMKNDGIDIFITALEVNGTARLAQAFDQVGYHPKVSFYGQQTYGSQFLALAGPASNGTVLALNHSITEDKGNNPAMATLVEWYNRTNPGGDIDFFAIQGWIAGAMFSDALRLAGPQPTRAKVLAALKTFTHYDASGLIAAINPAGKKPTPCFQVVTVDSQHWKRVDPAQGFICP